MVFFDVFYFKMLLLLLLIDVIRFVLLLAILGIASYHDVRTREVPDYLWIVGGIIGAVLYVFDWNQVDYFVLFSMGTGCAIACLVWKLFPMGDADALAILVASIVCPVSFGTVMSPVVIFFGGLIFEHLYAFFYNLRYNVADMVGKGGTNRIFGNVHNSWITKVMALYSVHLRRSHERFTFCAERRCNGKRYIDLKTPPADSEYEIRTGVFVTWAMPAFPFMTAAFVLGALFA